MRGSLRNTLVALALLATWLVFAAWQYHEFGHERKREQTDLMRQSEVLRQALLGGASAHRRLGRVFEEQMQAVFDEITETSGVIAVRLEAVGEGIVMNAGKTDLLNTTDGRPLWLPQGLQTSEEEQIWVLPPGQGQGTGMPGWFRGSSTGERPVTLRLTLLMDRTTADAAVRSAARLRVTVALAGGAVLLALGFAWAAAVRSVEAYAQTQALQAEKQRLEELSQAASGLAHETRNPLGVIRGGLQKMLLNGSPSPAASDRPKIKLLVEECDRVTSRINQFLAYARPQTAQMDVVAVKPLIEELCALLQSDLETTDVRLLPQIDGGCEAIVADAGLLRQVLFNLLQNAIAFSPAGEAVEVRVAKSQSNDVVIHVADRGPGVPEEMTAQLFSPYATTRPGGAGLGLAIVRRLAKEQHWTVRYEGRPDGGSLFLIEGIRVAT